MAGMRAEPVLIKRYGSDRLYDPAELCYLSLDDLAGMVRNGEQFVICDARTGEDITGEFLARLH
jgi:polyhydroxyalkanoate synthesis regulator protein